MVFSVLDVVQVLTDSTDPKQYIKKMRSRDPELAANWGTICTPVEMIAADGKLRKIQAANIEGFLRIIQSIPSPKAEPFKLWLAQVGRERIEEIIDPEQAIERRTGKPIVNSRNAAQLNGIVAGMIETITASGAETPPQTDDQKKK